MIGEPISKYRILSKLGEGGMGEVYLAEDTELRRKVALKFLPDELASNAEALARFNREAQTAAGLNHPNIVTVYEVGQHRGRPFIAMAYVDGVPLSEAVSQGGLSVTRAIEITLQILDGLASAHRAGIVHRDVKPGNIFIDSEGRVKILDFGLAKPGGAGKLTGELSTMGTVFYMSPEQTRGEEVDQRSDLFSLGAVLYEMLTGRPPFEGKHIAAVVYSITNEEPKPLSQLYQRVPRAMEQVVAKALSKNPDERYQSAGDMSEDLRRIQAGARPLASRPARRFLTVALPTTAVFIGVALFFILKPLKLQLTNDLPAVAAGNTLAVMYFENVVDPEDPRRLGEIASNLIITDLSESGHIQVVSSERLYDILKLKGKEGVKVVDKDTAIEVARDAGAKWMLMGSVLQERPTIVMTSRLVEVESGNVIASQRVTGGTGDEIFALVDRLTQDIKNDLALPAVARAGRDLPVAEVTTHSAEAYRYYLEGMENLNKMYGIEAKASFERALEFDSTFAMVYLRLATGVGSGSPKEKRDAVEKAVRYSDKVSKREKRYIQSTAALFAGDLDKAVAELEAIIRDYPNEKEAYKNLANIYRGPKRDLNLAVVNLRKAIEIDPLDKSAYNLLAYTYQELGDVDNYIWAIYQYMALAPDEANPYDSRADLYAFSGKLDKAIESYEEAVKRKPDFYPSVIKLGYSHLFRRDYEKAKGYFAQLLASGDPETRAVGRFGEMLIPLYQGRLDDALEATTRAIAGDRSDRKSGGGIAFLKEWQLVEILIEQGKIQAALENAERVAAEYREANPDDAWVGNQPLLYALVCTGDESRATALLGDLKKEIERASRTVPPEYWFWRGFVEGSGGDFEKGLASLAKARDKHHGFFSGYALAMMHLKAGRGVEAINEFDKLLRSYSEERAMFPFEGIKAHYYLGLAREELGRTDEAAASYEEFLSFWKDGDPAIEEIADAKSRLAALRQPG
jgi:tetratricopeptide (TPR) repeat protein/predicted Ser/Thr protein kinase